jgi:hypothetical protein
VLRLAIAPVLAPLAPILLAGGAMLGAMLAVRRLVDEPSGALGVALAAGAGAVVYLGALGLLARPALARAARGLRQLRPESGAPAELGEGSPGREA